MIDNIDFTDLEVERYWDFPKSFKGNKREFAKDAIFSGNYIGSLKKDGEFHRAVIDGDVLLQSRGISTVTGTYSNRADRVPHIVEELKAKVPDGTVLLGELHYLDLNKNNSDVGSILRCLPEKAIARQEGKYGRLHYYIFDILAYNGASLLGVEFEERTKLLKNIIKDIFKDSKYISVANYLEGQELWDELTEGLARGEEGVVLTRKNALYEPGKRTAKKTIKVKKELAEPIDVLFTGHYKLPTKNYAGKEIEDWIFWQDIRNDKKLMGKYYNDYAKGSPIEPITKPFYYGWAGSIEIGAYDKNKDEVVPIGYISGVSDEIKADIVDNNEKYCCKPCRVTCMELTKDNALRHPKFLDFRDDIDWKDCSLDKIIGEIDV